MKTTKKDYQLFINECNYWIKKFQLGGYEFRFHWLEMDDRANVSLDQIYSGLITVRFSRDIANFDNNYIKRMAKHEMIHCLLGAFSEAGFKRFVSRDDFDKEEEKLTNKLEKLIQ